MQKEYRKICKNELERIHSQMIDCDHKTYKEGSYINYMDLFELCFPNAILCNNIALEYGEELYGNMQYGLDIDEEGEYPEIYQWFIVEPNNYYYEEYKDEFITSYIDTLDLTIVGVDFYGLSWTLIPTNVKYKD